MSPASDKHRCDHSDLLSAFALRAIHPDEMPLVEAHISTCLECQQELERQRRVLDSCAAWRTEVLPPSTSLWDRLVDRIAAETEETEGKPVFSARPQWSEPEWEEVAPGISCKLLSSNTEEDRVSILVQLAPGVAYPPHSHAAVEELYLLRGVLWIGDRKLYPGDYNRAEPDTADQRVWSETGCTCVLITSPADVLL